MKIIMLSGKQGSGKTTLMSALMSELLDEGFYPCDVIFAKTIYAIHDFAISRLKSVGIERDIVKDGKLLQLLGTEWGRTTLGDDIWVRCLLGEIKAVTKNMSPDVYSRAVFVVSDCRFKNEFDGVPGAFKVRLEASSSVRKERCSQWRDNDSHPSEIDLDDYARQGKFDCYLDTQGNDIRTCVMQLMQDFNTFLLANK